MNKFVTITYYKPSTQQAYIVLLVTLFHQIKHPTAVSMRLLLIIVVVFVVKSSICLLLHSSRKLTTVLASLSTCSKALHNAHPLCS